MQNLRNQKKERDLGTIYLSKSILKKINLRSEKKLLRHYLSVIEQGTRVTFFNKFPFKVEFNKIHRNSLKPLIEAHKDLDSLNIVKGIRNHTRYAFPDNYPSSVNAWLNLKGGYLKINRDELLYLLENLEDNELRVYFALLLIKEAQKDQELPVETFPKVLREKHLNFSQKTLRKALDALSEKELLSLSIPICPQKRFFNRFVFSLKKFTKFQGAQKGESSCTETSTQKAQLHKNSAQFKENFSISNNLNQGESKETNTQAKLKKVSGFNFYGLDSLDRPLTKETIRNLQNQCSLTEEEIQESVRRFSDFIFSHEENLKSYSNPVGFLVTHMKNFNQIFIEPEWWIQRKSQVHLGKERFRKAFNSKQERRANNSKVQSALLKMLKELTPVTL